MHRSSHECVCCIQKAWREAITRISNQVVTLLKIAFYQFHFSHSLALPLSGPSDSSLLSHDRTDCHLSRLGQLLFLLRKLPLKNRSFRHWISANLHQNHSVSILYINHPYWNHARRHHNYLQSLQRLRTLSEHM